MSRRAYSLKLIALSMLAMGLSSCGDSEKPTYDYVPHMFDSPAIKAQEKGPDGFAGKLPVAGTMTIHQENYPFANDAQGASQYKNPLARTKSVLERGRKMYDTFCIVCHGNRAEGDGFIVPKFPRPPSLHSEKVKKWTDGNIFHVITMGQNIMPSYATQIKPEDRWAIVHYVRALQRSLDPTPEDVKEFEKLTQ